MKKPILQNKWEYEVKEAEKYGFELRVFQNDLLVYRQAGFGATSIAEVRARDYLLETEFGIERETE